MKPKTTIFNSTLLLFSFFIIFIFSSLNAQPFPADNATGVSVTPDFTTVNTYSVLITHDMYLDVSTTTNFGANTVVDRVYYPVLATNLRAWGDVLALQTDGDLAGVLEDEVQLAYNTTYYWRIQDNYGNTPGLEGNPIPYSFTTGLISPTLNAPVDGLTGVSVEPLMSWNASTGATSYKLYLDDANDFTTPIYEIDEGTNLSKQFTEIIANFPLDNNTMYYWKVAAVDQHGNEYDSPTYHFTTVPSVPVTMSLPNDASIVNMTDVTFYWYVIGQGTMKFKIQVFEDDGAAPDATDWLTPAFEATTTNSNQLFTLFQGTAYYWRVIVLSGGNEVIDYSATRGFTTGGGTTVTPIQSWPIGGVSVLTNTPTLYWYLSVFGPGLEYQVKYSISDAITGLELTSGDKFPEDVDMVVNGSDDLFITLLALTPGTLYYWQVRVYDPIADAYGEWSGVESFITQGSGTLVKPIASYPLGGITVYTTAPTLYWYTGTSGDGLTYNIDIETTTVGLDGVAEYNNVNALYKLLTATLIPGETYVWSVQSDNDGAATTGTGHESAWSDPVTFTVTGGSGNGYPIITWPVGNPTMYTTKPVINWFIQGSTLGLTDVVLRYQEGSNSTDWDNVYDGTISIPLPAQLYTFTFDLNEGSKYYFALASWDGLALSTWDEDAFTVYSAINNISDPVLTTPIGGINLASKSPTLYWFVVGDHTAIDDFEVTYSTSDVFDPAVTTVATPVTSYLALSNLSPGATYHWKVRTHYTDGTYSNYSVTETFSIDPGASAIQPIVGGPNNVVVHTSEPTISWVFPSEHSATLMSEILIADNPDMANAITIKDITNTNYIISDLEDGKSYFWKVRTKTTDNVYSEYSGQGVFKVGDDVTEVEESVILPVEFEVSQNYPNPFNPSTMIKYAIPEAQFVTLRIYNMLGQEVSTLVNNEVEAGIHNVIWNGVDNSGSKVSTGTYIYRVVAGNKIITKKMILLK